jgi:cysteine desulfurase
MPSSADRIYLDCNATAPILPEVVDAMRACWTEPALNPSSGHHFGRRARQLLEDARERICELLGAKTSGYDRDRIIFTSGGTESNNLAMRGLLRLPLGRRSAATEEGRGELNGSNHVIISAVEHPSITSLADELQCHGCEVDRLGVDARGVIRVKDLHILLRPETQLVAAMMAQNETGVLQPISELSVICQERGVLLHTDAAQVVGKLPADFRKLRVATMTIAAHKFHGPVGIGALVVRHGIDLRPQLFGGVQQESIRPGTLPVALIVGMCRALELWHAEQHQRAERMRALRDHFESAIIDGWPEARIIGAGAERLPHTSQIAFVGLERQMLFMALDQAGVACSTGSACASGSSEMSPVLLAMGCQIDVISSALRFSLGATTTATEVDEAARRILAQCNRLRQQKQA